MKLTLFHLTVAALVVVPAAGQAQSAAATAEAQAQAQARSPKARIDAAMQAAARAKVPASLLQSKVAEGEAKHVPPERIAAAVELRLQSLVRASETMSRANVESASEGELAVAADALQAGVTESALITVTRNAPAERRVVAVAVLADLVRLGHQSEIALARVNTALTSSAALANLNAEVASQLRLGGLTSTLDATGIVRIR
jgi:hypothetical protein